MAANVTCGITGGCDWIFATFAYSGIAWGVAFATLVHWFLSFVAIGDKSLLASANSKGLKSAHAAGLFLLPIALHIYLWANWGLVGFDGSTRDNWRSVFLNALTMVYSFINVLGLGMKGAFYYAAIDDKNAYILSDGMIERVVTRDGDKKSGWMAYWAWLFANAAKTMYILEVLSILTTLGLMLAYINTNPVVNNKFYFLGGSQYPYPVSLSMLNASAGLLMVAFAVNSWYKMSAAHEALREEIRSELKAVGVRLDDSFKVNAEKISGDEKTVSIAAFNKSVPLKQSDPQTMFTAAVTAHLEANKNDPTYAGLTPYDFRIRSIKGETYIASAMDVARIENVYFDKNYSFPKPERIAYLTTPTKLNNNDDTPILENPLLDHHTSALIVDYDQFKYEWMIYTRGVMGLGVGLGVFTDFKRPIVTAFVFFLLPFFYFFTFNAYAAFTWWVTVGVLPYLVALTRHFGAWYESFRYIFIIMVIIVRYLYSVNDQYLANIDIWTTSSIVPGLVTPAATSIDNSTTVYATAATSLALSTYACAWAFARFIIALVNRKGKVTSLDTDEFSENLKNSKAAQKLGSGMAYLAKTGRDAASKTGQVFVRY